MKTLLTANLSTKTANSGGSVWTPPAFTFGEAMTLALRFQEDLNGQTVEPTLDIRGVYAALGPIDARPASGEWALQVGPGPQTADNTTDDLKHECTAAQLASAINAKAAIVSAYGNATVLKEDGSWRIRFGTGTAQVELRVVENRLRPASLGRCLASQIDGAWWHEVRLVQSPLALTDVGERILPPAPTVTRVRSGGSDGGYQWNEIQALYVPPDFRATYALKIGAYARTAELSVSDNGETILAALEEAAGQNFKVTNPKEFTAHIEFINDFEGLTHDLIEVIPLNPPEGDLTFTLPLDRAELHARLRSQAEVTETLEVRIRVADADELITERVAFRQDVTVQRPLIFPELATVPVVDFLRPLSPKDYVPFIQDNVITGHQFYPAVVGNGEASAFPVAHGLDTELVFVFARENTSNGRQLVHGTDFSVQVNGADEVTVTALGDVPGENAWVVTVVSAQTVAAFAEGLEVTIGQVVGLQDQLDAIGAQIAQLLTMVPTTPLGTKREGGGTPLLIEIPAATEVFPGQAGRLESGAIDLKALPRPGGLLPALHDATITEVTTTLPDVAASAGGVYQNKTGAALLVPGGLGTRSSYLAADGYVGSDGRRWYPLTRAGATNSFFPRDFERSLFAFAVNSAMLRAGSTLELEFQLAVQLLNATSRAQYLLVIEHGTAPSQATPDPTSTNLQDVVWAATPLLTQRVLLSENKVTHQFGVELIRASDGTLSANKVLYGFATPADAVPAAADCALRARLIQFDTENSVTNARGTVFFALSEAQASITA